MAEKVVTRIAPSPTGEMHIGTVRTALFNYIFAKQRAGTYFVRIEDTHKERNKPEWVDAIWRDFEWVGLEPDAKYVQSKNLERHKELLKKLVDEGRAYISREPKQDDPTQEVEVVRLKNPGTTITFNDLIRGPVTFDTTEHGDFVIARSIDDPLYHFAVVVDDGDEGVTHVLRAEEHISNTPRQILILEALGFARPVYGHFPLILAPDRSKLSKRKHGASIENYRKQGFIPEAILNYLALLGWNPGTPQEIFSLDQLMHIFSIDRMQKSGAIFDMHKMLWFNHEHLKLLSDNEYAHRLTEFAGHAVDMRLVPLLKERVQTLEEAAVALKEEFGFLAEISYDPILLLQSGKISAEAASNHLKQVEAMLTNIPDEGFTASQLKDILWPYATAQGRGEVLWPLRVALTGRERSPDPFVVAALVGKEKTLARIAAAASSL